MRTGWLWVAVVCCLSSSACVIGSKEWNALRGDPYPLDAVDRELEAGVALECSSATLVTYDGDIIKYNRAVKVAPDFVPHLKEFERIVSATAKKYYGRDPTRILHLGAYNCRKVRGHASRLSEHALGNAIDIHGFDFVRLRKRDASSSHLRGPFGVRIKKHWRPSDARTNEPPQALHEEFLLELLEQIQEHDTFRGIVGPSHANHGNHFHFDYGPWSYTAL